MPGGGGRIDHPNVNSYVVGKAERPSKPKAAKKAAASKPAAAVTPNPTVEVEDPTPTPDSAPAV